MDTTQKTLKQLPHTPGVYQFFDAHHQLLYIGKAVDLSRRVKQYFERDDAIGAKTPLLVPQVVGIETIQTASEFDALLLEAELIRINQPKYNSLSKDDKSPLYILITFSEELPRILSIRKNALAKKQEHDDALFGPFQSGAIARMVLRRLRHIFPFCTQKIRNGIPCFYTHIGLCDPCPSVITKIPKEKDRKKKIQEYRHHLYRIRDILCGKSQTLLRTLEKEMNETANKNEFESATIIKKQIDQLKSLQTKHFDPHMYISGDRGLYNAVQSQLSSLIETLHQHYPPLSTLTRIECFDISNTHGANAVGSMVVFTDGIADTRQYRKFLIRSKKTPDDVAMIAEVLTRRLNHPKWPYPDLVVIDGGKGHVSAAKEVFSTSYLSHITHAIPLIGLAKREEEIIVPADVGFATIRLKHDNPGLHLLQRIRDEAHRFAITYHRKLRSLTMLL